MVTAAEQGEQTRSRLMTAAVELIAERGWGAVTTRMVAERAGLRPGLVHYHFRSVTDLLIDASLESARAEYAAVIAGMTAVSGPEAMSQLLGAIGAYSTTNPASLAMTEMMLAASRHERLRDALRRFAAEARAMLTGWFREHTAVADPEATATTILALLDGLILHRMIDPGLSAVDVTGPLLRAAGLTDSRATEGNSHAPEPGRQTSH